MPRFRLKSLLILVALSAFAFWAFWIGWPAWERYRFESPLKQLKVGATESDIERLSPGQTFYAETPTNGGMIEMTTFATANYDYCIYRKCAVPAGVVTQNYPCESIAIFRLPHVPPDYPSPPSGFAMGREEYYISDFFLLITKSPVKATFPVNFKYELIHADPPK